MSYILDALKRADAERARHGTAPQATPRPDAPVVWAEHGGGPLLPPWSWAVGGALLAAVAVWLATPWWSATRSLGPATAPGLAAAPQAPSAQVASGAVVAAPMAPEAAASAPSPASSAASNPARAQAKPAPIKKPKPVRPPTAPRPAQGDAADAPASPPVRVTNAAALPPDLRRAVPSLTFGGSVYSNAPAQRMLFVNGQLLHEGDALGPGATLDEIGPRGAVLKYKGQRYEVPY